MRARGWDLAAATARSCNWKEWLGTPVAGRVLGTPTCRHLDGKLAGLAHARAVLTPADPAAAIAAAAIAAIAAVVAIRRVEPAAARAAACAEAAVVI